MLGNEPRHVEGLRPWISNYKILCKSLEQIQRLISEVILHRMTNILGERLAPIKDASFARAANAVLRILDRSKPLTKRAAMR